MSEEIGRTPELALNHVIKSVVENSLRFYTIITPESVIKPRPNSYKNHAPYFGTWKEDLCIDPKILKRWLNDGNYDYNKVIEYWRQNNYLNTLSPNGIKPVLVETSIYYLVCIKSSVIKEELLSLYTRNFLQSGLIYKNNVH